MMASLMKWSPISDMMRMGVNFDPFFGEFLHPEENLDFGYCIPPAVESYRHNGSLVIRMDLPGVSPKDVHLTYENGYLTIEGERKRHRQIEAESFLRDEVCYGSFRRTLHIPEGIRGDKMKARYSEGVLEVTAPMEEKFVPKKIEVEEVKS
jgi:HSP20 family protein